MDVVIKLISQTLTTDELGYPIASETFYETFAKVRSVTQTEFFSAGKNGITPDFSFVVNDAEYHGQRLLEYEGNDTEFTGHISLIMIPLNFTQSIRAE